MNLSKPALLAEADWHENAEHGECQPRHKIAADLFRLTADASDGFEAWKSSKMRQGQLRYMAEEVQEAWQAATLAASAKYEQRIAELEQLLNAPTLAREQPCGCLVCQCIDDKTCHGCGAKRCRKSDCVFNDPNLKQAIFIDEPSYSQLKVRIAEQQAYLEDIDRDRAELRTDLRDMCAEVRRFWQFVGNALEPSSRAQQILEREKE